MTPALMLSLWRERWGKAAGTSFKVPYVHGKVNRWTDGLPQSSVWSVTGVPVLALLLCIFLMGLLMCIDLSLESQIVFSAVFICIAVYVRRYAGTLMTLVLVGMAVISSTRYLYWRFDATLVPEFSLHFIFGFYLWVAECYLALLVFTAWVQSVWPLKRASVPLPADQGTWPTVDVFIRCDDQPFAAIQLTGTAAGKLKWPRKKMKIYLIDGAQQDDLFALAASIGAHYLPHADASGSPTVCINRSLPSTTGEFIAVLESGQLPDPYFLQASVGWFSRDQKLGMVQTPDHFLAPGSAPHPLMVNNLPAATASCALIRRSAMTESGSVDTAALTPDSPMALVLESAGFATACIDLGGQAVTPADDPGQNEIVDSASGAAPEIFLIEQPWASRSTRWKQRVQAFNSVLQFYYPVPRLLFLTAPVVYLLGHVQIIQTLPQLFLAYAVPHFVIAHIALTRTDEKNRLKLFTDLRETALAWYLLVPTTLTLIRTGLRQIFASFKAGRSEPASKPHKAPVAGAETFFSPSRLLPYLLVLGLNVAGFSAGMLELMLSNRSPWEASMPYLFWAACNLMLLAAMLAVAQEARQVLKHTRLQQHLPAMLKLPSGRTVSCTTDNFPARLLDLSLPTPAGIQPGATVSLSIFHAHRELVFPAIVVVQQDLSLGVRIAEAFQPDYQALATAVLSRGPDWPKWLPGSTADQLLPRWLTNAWIAVAIALLDFATNINKHLHWARLDSWIKLWKSKK